MPANLPALAPSAKEALVALGTAIRLRRKALKVSAVAAAEGAGISRVTLHRIEKGEPAVTMGAYVAVCRVLGLDIFVQPQDANAAPPESTRKGWIPSRVRITDYPVLKQLAWHVHGTPELTPREALDIYERNQRHIDATVLTETEKDLLDALRHGLGHDRRV